MLDKHEFIGGHPMLNRKRVKLVMIDAVLKKLEQEKPRSLILAADLVGCTRNQMRMLYTRQYERLGIKTLADICDSFDVKISVGEFFGVS